MTVKEPILVKHVTYNDHKFEVGFVSRDRDLLQGYIEGGTNRIQFTWRPGKYNRPALYGKVNYKDPAVQAWVKGILDTTSSDLISDNHTGGGDKAMETYVSKLITSGHVRMPCWVKHNGVEHGILRRACVVNADKLELEALKQADEYVAMVNTVVESQGRPVCHKEMVSMFKEQ